MSSLTPLPTMGPVPRIEVVVEPSDLITDTVTATIRRRHEGRTFEVRGGVRKSAESTLVVMDFEAPFNTQALFEAACYDEAGVYMGAVQLDTATLNYNGTVIQHPFDPRVSVEVRRLSGFAENVTYGSTGELVYPDAPGLGNLVGFGGGRGVTGLPVDILVDGYDDADMLQATLGTYETPRLKVWLVRTPPPMRIPRVLFCWVPDLTEKDMDVRNGGSLVRFQATLTEIEPPAPGLSPAVLRHSDVKALFSTHSQVEAAYTLHSDIKRDQSLVGAGG